jgi:hypothetical protein
MRTHFSLVPSSFVSEPIIPLAGTFDAAAMSRGEPGLPGKFRWRRKEFTVALELERWREHGDCRNGSGERYVRKHGFRVRTEDGSILRLYFQRTVGRGQSPKSRWWLHSIESCAPAGSTAQ